MAYIGQRDDEWEAEQRKKERKLKRAAMTACPECGKKVLGLKDHLRDVHRLRMLPQQKKIRTVPLDPV